MNVRMRSIIHAGKRYSLIITLNPTEVFYEVISLWNTYSDLHDRLKKTKVLVFEIELRTSKRKQDILYITLGDIVVSVTINSISLFVQQIIPSPETQYIFNEAISKTFLLSYESWTTDLKPVDTAREFQIDISSLSIINSPLQLIAAHQKTQRPDPADPAIYLSNYRFINAIFDHAEVRKYYSEPDGILYP